MLPPDQDLAARRPVWDALQMFWMDTDPALFLESAVRICTRSAYSLDEIEQIFWHEVKPAAEFNLCDIAGEWTGFDLDWLTTRILETHRSGSGLPVAALHEYADKWWQRLREGILQSRAG